MLPIKSIVVIAVLFSGTASFADQDPVREKVQAELARAQAAGEMDGINEAWDGTIPAARPAAAGVFGRPFAAPDTLSRAEVMAEYERARRSGELAEHRLIFATGGD